jgi:hypothetical protein
MYYTEQDPFTGEPLFVEKNLHRKAVQKDLVTRKQAVRPITVHSRSAASRSPQRKDDRRKSHG